MKKVFISYRSSEGIAVDGLISAIREAGEYEVWYDQHLQGGQKWWDEIIKQIQRADIVVLALSNDYLESKPCRLEREYAQELGKAIIPVQIDHTLNYKHLDDDTKSRQVIRYHAYDRDRERLQQALTNVQSLALPDPMPVPPPAPRDDSGDDNESDKEKQNNQMTQKNNKEGLTNNQVILIGSLISGFVAIIVAVIGILPNVLDSSNPPNLPVPSATSQIIVNSPIPSETSQPTANNNSTPVPAVNVVSGDFDLSLIYGGSDSFTIRANAESHLFGLTLSGENGDEIPTDSFPALNVTGYVIEDGTCLQYIRSGSAPPRPRGCLDNATFMIELLDADLFWYNVGRNQAQDLAVRQVDDLISLCSSASSQCNVTSP